MGPARPDFDYGNARLRVRKAALLDRADYGQLLDNDLQGALGAIAGGPYGSDLEAVRERFSGLRALHEAVRRHLARALEDMRALYADSARTLVDLLLSKWDLQNLLTLLRGRAAAAPVDETLASLVPIGALDEPAAAEAAGQSDAGRAAELLVTRRLPTPDLARALARAWPAYVRTEDLANLEHALVIDHIAYVRARVAGFGDAGEPLARELEREVEARDILTALRPAQSSRRREAVAALAGSVRDEGLRRILRSWSPSEGLAALQDRFEHRCAGASLQLFASDDPLGVAIPIAFAAAKEAEARNLRLIGEGLACGIDRAQLAARLLLVGGQTR